MFSMSVRYKILLSILIPIVFFVTLFTFYLTEELRVYLYLRQVPPVIEIIGKMGALAEGMQKERELTLILQDTHLSELEQLLTDVKQKNNESIVNIMQLLDNSQLTIQGKKITDFFKDTKLLLTQLNERRRAFNVGGIDQEHIYLFYLLINQAILQEMNQLILKTGDAETVLQLLPYMDILQEQLAAGKEHRALYQAFTANAFTPFSQRSFTVAMTEQEIFWEAFKEKISETDRANYLKVLQAPMQLQSDAMRAIALDKTEDFGVDPNHWWTVKSEQIQLIVTVGNQLLEQAEQMSVQRAYRKISGFLIVLTLLIFGIGMRLYFIHWNIKILGNQLIKELLLLNEAETDIEHSISDTATTIHETAATVFTTTSLVDALKYTGQITVERANKVVEVTHQTLKILQSSGKSLELTLIGIDQIRESITIISESIRKLNEHTYTIRSMIEIVDDLAEQSHLLAVSASIEASQAGELGKGFAVVAQEMRSLAEQSKQATVQVRILLNDIKNASGAAVLATELGFNTVHKNSEQSGETQQLLQMITKQINDVVETTEAIAVSNQKQFAEFEHIATSMAVLSRKAHKQIENMAIIETRLQRIQSVQQRLHGISNLYKS